MLLVQFLCCVTVLYQSNLIGCLGHLFLILLLFWQVSESLLVQTPAVPPGPCLPPRLQGRPKAKEIQLRWGNFHLVMNYNEVRTKSILPVKRPKSLHP